MQPSIDVLRYQVADHQASLRAKPAGHSHPHRVRRLFGHLLTHLLPF